MAEGEEEQYGECSVGALGLQFSSDCEGNTITITGADHGGPLYKIYDWVTGAAVGTIIVPPNGPFPGPQTFPASRFSGTDGKEYIGLLVESCGCCVEIKVPCDKTVTSTTPRPTTSTTPRPTTSTTPRATTSTTPRATTSTTPRATTSTTPPPKEPCCPPFRDYGNFFAPCNEGDWWVDSLSRMQGGPAWGGWCNEQPPWTGCEGNKLGGDQGTPGMWRNGADPQMDAGDGSTRPGANIFVSANNAIDDTQTGGHAALKKQDLPQPLTFAGGNQESGMVGTFMDFNRIVVGQANESGKASFAEKPPPGFVVRYRGKCYRVIKDSEEWFNDWENIMTPPSADVISVTGNLNLGSQGDGWEVCECCDGINARPCCPPLTLPGLPAGVERTEDSGHPGWAGLKKGGIATWWSEDSAIVWGQPAPINNCFWQRVRPPEVDGAPINNFIEGERFTKAEFDQGPPMDLDTPAQQPLAGMVWKYKEKCYRIFVDAWSSSAGDLHPIVLGGPGCESDGKSGVDWVKANLNISPEDDIQGMRDRCDNQALTVGCGWEECKCCPEKPVEPVTTSTTLPPKTTSTTPRATTSTTQRPGPPITTTLAPCCPPFILTRGRPAVGDFFDDGVPKIPPGGAALWFFKNNDENVYRDVGGWDNQISRPVKNEFLKVGFTVKSKESSGALGGQNEDLQELRLLRNDARYYLRQYEIAVEEEERLSEIADTFRDAYRKSWEAERSEEFNTFNDLPDDVSQDLRAAHDAHQAATNKWYAEGVQAFQSAGDVFNQKFTKILTRFPKFQDEVFDYLEGVILDEGSNVRITSGSVVYTSTLFGEPKDMLITAIELTNNESWDDSSSAERFRKLLRSPITIVDQRIEEMEKSGPAGPAGPGKCYKIYSEEALDTLINVDGYWQIPPEDDIAQWGGRNGRTEKQGKVWEECPCCPLTTQPPVTTSTTPGPTTTPSPTTPPPTTLPPTTPPPPPSTSTTPRPCCVPQRDGFKEGQWYWVNPGDNYLIPYNNTPENGMVFFRLPAIDLKKFDEDKDGKFNKEEHEKFRAHYTKIASLERVCFQIHDEDWVADNKQVPPEVDVLKTKYPDIPGVGDWLAQGKTLADLEVEDKGEGWIVCECCPCCPPINCSAYWYCEEGVDANGNPLPVPDVGEKPVEPTKLQFTQSVRNIKGEVEEKFDEVAYNRAHRQWEVEIKKWVDAWSEYLLETNKNIFIDLGLFEIKGIEPGTGTEPEVEDFFKPGAEFAGVAREPNNPRMVLGKELNKGDRRRFENLRKINDNGGFEIVYLIEDGLVVKHAPEDRGAIVDRRFNGELAPNAAKENAEERAQAAHIDGQVEFLFGDEPAHVQLEDIDREIEKAQAEIGRLSLGFEISELNAIAIDTWAETIVELQKKKKEINDRQEAAGAEAFDDVMNIGQGGIPVNAEVIPPGTRANPGKFPVRANFDKDHDEEEFEVCFEVIDAEWVKEHICVNPAIDVLSEVDDEDKQYVKDLEIEDKGNGWKVCECCPCPPPIEDDDDDDDDGPPDITPAILTVKPKGGGGGGGKETPPRPTGPTTPRVMTTPRISVTTTPTVMTSPPPPVVTTLCPPDTPLEGPRCNVLRF